MSSTVAPGRWITATMSTTTARPYVTWAGLPGGPGTRVRSDAAVTTVTDEDGRATIYRRAELEKGKVGSPRTLPGTHTGAVVPYAEHLLSLTDNGKGAAQLAVYDREGKRVASPDVACEDPRGGRSSHSSFSDATRLLTVVAHRVRGGLLVVRQCEQVLRRVTSAPCV